MFRHLITSLPMLVCLFWAALLWMDWRRQGLAAKLRLMAFSVAAAMLYAGHYAFFNHEYGIMPVTDTLYSMANLAVFPLYYLYLLEVTEREWDRRRQVTLLLPSIITGIAVGVCYACMSEGERMYFIENQLYAQNSWGGGQFSEGSVACALCSQGGLCRAGGCGDGAGI